MNIAKSTLCKRFILLNRLVNGKRSRLDQARDNGDARDRGAEDNNASDYAELRTRGYEVDNIDANGFVRKSSSNV
jgi:hypothetical protein